MVSKAVVLVDPSRIMAVPLLSRKSPAMRTKRVYILMYMHTYLIDLPRFNKTHATQDIHSQEKRLTIDRRPVLAYALLFPA
jgi:hypothetical protein